MFLRIFFCTALSLPDVGQVLLKTPAPRGGEAGGALTVYAVPRLCQHQGCDFDKKEARERVCFLDENVRERLCF